jgi:SAM-dependent methyltransferase
MSDEPPRGDDPKVRMPTLPGAASVPPPSAEPRGASQRPPPITAPPPSARDGYRDVPPPPQLPALDAWGTSVPVHAPDETPPLPHAALPVITTADSRLIASAPVGAGPISKTLPSERPTDSSPRRRSRRTVKIPDDAVPNRTPEPPRVAAVAPDSPVNEGPATRLEDLNFSSSPELDTVIKDAPESDGAVTSRGHDIDDPLTEVMSEPEPATTRAPVSARVSDVPPPPISQQPIRPARIISIGSEPPPAPSPVVVAPVVSPDVTPRASMSAIVDATEAGSTIEELEAVEEVEAVSLSHPKPPSIEPGPRSEEDSLEEIELDDRPSIIEEAVAPAPPRKPPPPPPKRPQLTSQPDFAAVSQPTSQPISQAVQSAPTPSPTPVITQAAPPTGSLAAAPAATPPPPVPSVKRQKQWWEELFGDDFLRTMDRLAPRFVRKECDFIEDRLGVEKGAVVLDLACGAGQHAVELASRGYSVVGYDLSLAMLAQAADEAQERAQKLNFLQGDMRDMAFEEMFDAVYCWGTSFGYFEEEKNFNVLQRIHRALRTGGMLMLDVINHDYVVCRQPSLVWFEGDGCVCMDDMQVDSFTSRLRVKRTVMFEDGRTREVDYAIRLYALHELGKMLHEVGFKVLEVSGHPSHPGVFFGSESPRIIILAERSTPKPKVGPSSMSGPPPTNE